MADFDGRFYRAMAAAAGLSRADREAEGDHLFETLTEICELLVQFHSLRQNVRGTQFQGLEEVLDDRFHTLLRVADDLVDQIWVLGLAVPESVRNVASRVPVESVGQADGAVDGAHHRAVPGTNLVVVTPITADKD